MLNAQPLRSSTAQPITTAGWQRSITAVLLHWELEQGWSNPETYIYIYIEIYEEEYEPGIGS